MALLNAVKATLTHLAQRTSSTSISAALGFTVGRDMGMPTGDAIAVIGDGSISAGMAYEALNNAGT